MASGVLTLPPLGDLGIAESSRSQEPVAQPSPPTEAGAAAVSSESVEASQLLGTAAGVDGEGVAAAAAAAAREPVGVENLEEKGGVVGTTDEVEAYEKRIEAALAGTMSVEAKSKAQESLRSFLLRHPSQQCLVRSPSEKHVVENEEAVKDVVAVLADAEFPGGPEVKEAVGALGVPALARPLLLLFQKVHTTLPLLTVTVAPLATQQLHQHHFNNPFMADYQSPVVVAAGAGASPAQQQPLSARPPAGPSTTPRPDGGASPAAAAEVVVAVAAVKLVPRGPPTPPDINR